MNDTNKLAEIQKKAEKRNKARNIFTIFLVIVLVLFFFIMAFENLFNIRGIVVTGISEFVPYDSKAVETFLDIKKDTNLITYDSDDAERALLYEFPYIKEVKVKKKLPATLVVEITENRGTMYLELGNDTFIISSEGRVLEINKDPFYDGIKRTRLLTQGVKRCVCGEDVGFDNPEKLDILRQITSALEKYSLGGRITEIDTSAKFNIKLTYDNRFKIIFGSFEKADAKVKLLSEMLDSEIWNDSTGEIDISNASEALVKFTGNVAN